MREGSSPDSAAARGQVSILHEIVQHSFWRLSGSEGANSGDNCAIGALNCAVNLDRDVGSCMD